MTQIQLGDITVDVEQKNIKNIHLRVYPPDGRVRISAPARMDLETIRVFATSKLGWIKKQQKKLQIQQRETPREFLDRESHYVWGKRYLLKVIEQNAAPSVELKHSQMLLSVRPGSNKAKRQAVLEEWYRQQLKQVVPLMIAKWEMMMSVEVKEFFLQRMKTRWGTCSPRKRSIRLNTALACKPFECLEYVIVHEMAHMLVPNHGARFIALMDRYVPHWKQLRDELNRSPLGHVEWEY